jgi:hypothetical protein
MSESMFYTKFKIPDEMPARGVVDLLAWLDDNRSIAKTLYRPRQGTVYILVADHYHNLKFSECPLPGSHDFAAGWLACVAMHTVSKKLGMPMYWQEAEYYSETGQLRNKQIRRADKPPIRINWRDWEEA